MRAVSIHVEDDTYQRFKALAACKGRSIAALLREAMAEYLRREQKSGPSILDIAPHPSGKMLATRERSELLDEMLER